MYPKVYGSESVRSVLDSVLFISRDPRLGRRKLVLTVQAVVIAIYCLSET